MGRKLRLMLGRRLSHFTAEVSTPMGHEGRGVPKLQMRRVQYNARPAGRRYAVERLRNGKSGIGSGGLRVPGRNTVRGAGIALKKSTVDAGENKILD